METVIVLRSFYDSWYLWMLFLTVIVLCYLACLLFVLMLAWRLYIVAQWQKRKP